MLRKVHFRLTSVAQKRCCLSSLMLAYGRGRWAVSQKPKKKSYLEVYLEVYVGF